MLDASTLFNFSCIFVTGPKFSERRCGIFLLGLGERWIKIVNYVVTKCILAFKKSVKITKILNEFIVYFGFILTICLTFFVYEGFNNGKSGTFSD